MQWETRRPSCSTARASCSDRTTFGDVSGSSSSDGSDHWDGEEEEFLRATHVLSREQLVGVTALACDGPRLLTGNAEGRVLFQDFTRAVVRDSEAQRAADAQRPNAATQEGRAASTSRFWHRPR